MDMTRQASLNDLSKMPPQLYNALMIDALKAAAGTRPQWRQTARPEQIAPPGDWSIWLILAGRGWGKTRTGAEWLREQAQAVPLLRIVAPTFADARDVCVEGESGLKRICAAGELTKWNRSIGEGEFSNGARFKVFSGAEPERLRGPQSYADWYDELGAWQYPQDTWDMAMMGLRLGQRPRAVVTTTPRPLPLIRTLTTRADVVMTRGNTYENRANLAPSFFANIISSYDGTRLGRQEINAELLEDTPGALWTMTMIDDNRASVIPEFIRIVVGVDPEAVSTSDSAETGIIVAGKGRDGHGYVLGDYSLRGMPDTWARAVRDAYSRWKADRIVAEINNGGEMVEHTLRTVDAVLPITTVTASRGKQTRAEPISALYAQGRVHHVGVFSTLETQMTTWVPGDRSPDRMDALVWALTELELAGAEGYGEIAYAEPYRFSVSPY